MKIAVAVQNAAWGFIDAVAKLIFYFLFLL